MTTAYEASSYFSDESDLDSNCDMDYDPDFYPDQEDNDYSCETKFPLNIKEVNLNSLNRGTSALACNENGTEVNIDVKEEGLDIKPEPQLHQQVKIAAEKNQFTTKSPDRNVLPSTTRTSAEVQQINDAELTRYGCKEFLKQSNKDCSIGGSLGPNISLYGPLAKERKTYTTTYGRYECPICFKGYVRSDHFDGHLAAHGYDKNNVPVKTVSKQHNNNSYALGRHCHLCNKTFSHCNSLATHMRTHNGYRPFECDICHRRFTTRGHQEYHLRTHTGVKPFQCEICFKVYSSKYYVKKHMLNHTSKESYECRLCHEEFDKNCHRRRRKRRDRNREFLCKICRRSFFDFNNYCRHKRIHHNKLSVTVIS